MAARLLLQCSPTERASRKCTCRYIKWTQETYRSGGAKAQLVPLLEQCTRELQAIPRYRTDHRYLRIWIQYVSVLHR